MSRHRSLLQATAWAALGLAALGAAGSKAQAAPGPQVVVSPPVALYGAPFSVKVTGLRPHQPITVRAASTDAKNVHWESSARFEADPTGVVDLATSAPTGGDYRGADVFGLIWSMKPQVTKSPGRYYADDEVNGWTIDFSASDSAGPAVTSRLRCVYQMPGQPLVRVPLEQEGLYGFLYRPAGTGPFPAVLILGGSNGGLYEWLAQAFASNGFAALTLAYFRYRDLPAELVDIPIERFERAIRWLKAQPAVRPDRVAIVGGSRGGELALYLASRSRDCRAVVGWTPGEHLWEGMTKRFFDPDYVPVASWTLGGKPLPFLPWMSTAEEKEREKKGELGSVVPIIRRALAQSDPALIERARIRVEDIRVPLLLISGTDDRTWPSVEFCDDIEARLRAAGSKHEVRHVVFEGGGHPSFLPWLITANQGEGSIDGGTPQANVQGGYRSWAETIAFLHRHLDR